MWNQKLLSLDETARLAHYINLFACSNQNGSYLVPLAGVEPASQNPESWGLSISLQGLMSPSLKFGNQRRRVQESNLLGFSPDGFRNHYLTVRPTLLVYTELVEVRARRDSNPQPQDPQSRALSNYATGTTISTGVL